MSNYERETAEYEALAQTLEGKEILKADAWPPLPKPPTKPEINLKWFPPPLRDMIQAVSVAYNAKPDIAAIVGLGATSACTTGRIKVKVKPDWTEPAQLYLLAAARSGAGKTPTYKAMCGFLDEYQIGKNKERQIQIVQEEAALRAMKGQAERYEKRGEIEKAKEAAREMEEWKRKCVKRVQIKVNGNVTPERLAEIMQENGGATSIMDDEGYMLDIVSDQYSQHTALDPYLAGHSGGTVEMQRKGTGQTLVETAALTVCTLTQPSALQEVMENKRLVGKGLLPRFLISCPDSMTKFADGESVPAAVAKAYEGHLFKLLDEPKHTFTLSAGASALLLDFREEIFYKNTTVENNILGPFLDKLPGNTARLAAMLHLWSEVHTDEIPVATIQNAIELARYFIGHMELLVGSEDAVSAPAKETLTWLMRRRAEEVSAHEVRQALVKRKAFPTSESVTAALAELAQAGYIRLQRQQSRGRPVEVVQLHPDLLKGVIL